MYQCCANEAFSHNINTCQYIESGLEVISISGVNNGRPPFFCENRLESFPSLLLLT